MQIGMIGLGRMGANMVRRLLKAGHECVVFDMSPKTVEDLAKEKATGASSLQDLARKLEEAARGVDDGAGRGGGQDHLGLALPFLEKDDILIDGGNSYYVDDIRRAKQLSAEGPPLRRRGHEWRRVGPRTWLLPDDRRRGRRGRSTSTRSSPTLAPGDGLSASYSGTRQSPARHRRAWLSALRTERCRAFREDGPQRHRVRHDGCLRRGLEHPPRGERRETAGTPSMPRPRRCATRSTTSTTSTSPTSTEVGVAAASSHPGCWT